MRIKKFKKFKESLVINIKDLKAFDLNESLSIWYDSLLNSIGAKELNIYDVLKLNKNFNINLDNLEISDDFVKALSNQGLKKSNMENSDDYETFLSVPCRFMFIYDSKASELDTPYFLLLQTYNSVSNKYETTKCYQINDNIKKFYDQLSSKIIEIEDNGEKFIYETGDRNNWHLKSVKETDIYKRNFNKEDLEKTVNDRKVKIKIIGK